MPPDRPLVRVASTDTAGVPTQRDSRGLPRASGDPHFFATDDCAVVMTYMPGAEITVVPGEETNIKLTYADDAARIEDIIRRRAGKDI